jgi:phage tail protein X
MAEYSTLLKLGTTGILLDMIEARAKLPELELSAPQDAIRQVSRDLDFACKLALRHGGKETSLGIQRLYWQAAEFFISRHQRDDRMSQQIMQIWGDILTALERKDLAVADRLDWAIKRQIYGEVLKQLNTTWEELDDWGPVLAHTWKVTLPQLEPENWSSWFKRRLPAFKWGLLEIHCRDKNLDWRHYRRLRNAASTLRVLDVLYHDIDQKRGLFYQLAQIETVVDEAQIETVWRKSQPPEDTRAAVRAYAIQLAYQHNKKIKMDWDRVYLEAAHDQILLSNPLDKDISAVEHVFAPPSKPLKTVSQPETSQFRPQEANEDELEIMILDVEEYNPE